METASKEFRETFSNEKDLTANHMNGVGQPSCAALPKQKFARLALILWVKFSSKLLGWRQRRL